jgi:CHAT domain-containing protein
LDLRPDLPHSLLGAVERALSNDPAQRFRSIGALAQQLNVISETKASARSLSGGRELFEKISLTLSDSATLWANAKTLKSPQPLASAHTLLAISQASLDPQQLANATRLPSAWRNPGALQPLTFVESEIAAIIASTKGAKSTHLKGKMATEQASLAQAPQAQHIHFATHGYFDALVPLDSGLLLSADAALAGSKWHAANSDGYLQAWEIFDQWQIQASTVTLSACESRQFHLNMLWRMTIE